MDSVNWYDTLRKRLIPVAFYLPKTNEKIINQKVILVSHGYAENKPGQIKAIPNLTKI